jgi:hypothetical protein
MVAQKNLENAISIEEVKKLVLDKLKLVKE